MIAFATGSVALQRWPNTPTQFPTAGPVSAVALLFVRHPREAAACAAR
jgi:hypothetical protein